MASKLSALSIYQFFKKIGCYTLLVPLGFLFVTSPSYIAILLFLFILLAFIWLGIFWVIRKFKEAFARRSPKLKSQIIVASLEKLNRPNIADLDAAALTKNWLKEFEAKYG